jgi:hypothetical protein
LVKQAQPSHEQEGSSPGLKNQSPQEKRLGALATLNEDSLVRIQNKDVAKAIYHASKTSESWLQSCLQSMAQENALASASLLQDLKDFSDCKDVRKHLDENSQLVTFGRKVVAVTSPDFLREHAMPSAMMRKRAKDLIQARSLIDCGAGESDYDLQDEDRHNVLVNCFTMASTIEEEGGIHLNGSRLDRRLRTEDNEEDADTNVAEEATSPPIMTSPFTLEEKLVALDDAQAKGLSRLHFEFQSHEDQLLKMVINDLDDPEDQSKKIAAVNEQTTELADKTVQLHKTSHASQRQRLIQSAHVDDLRCSMSRMVAECEVVCQEVDTLQRVNQSKVNSEIAQIQRQFEVTLTEHKKQVQDLLSQLKEPLQIDTDFDVKTRSRLTRRVGTAQSELLKSQIANAVLIERLNLDLLKWGRVPVAIRDTIDKLHDEIWADQAKKALREMTKNYSEPAKMPMNELGLREIQRVTTAGVQRSPAEAGDGVAPATFNFVPTTLHLPKEEMQLGNELRLQFRQNVLESVTTGPKHRRCQT